MVGVLNEERLQAFAPSAAGSNFECDYEEYNYSRIAKAFVHIWVVPLILFVLFESKVSFAHYIPLTYIGCVTFLYCTVFKKQSEEYFGVLIFSVSMIMLLIFG
ncbi:hypothetical protein [Sulfuricurvum sp.]|uniref:hypothetical protein n=1 Tax=Sulfuricurvum sp. TaxID=2025608 RepID=UPI002620BAF5|nr:hypothetical protein [Sulfuricurvum sp.]MDD3597443.1 hypothetical protein [Sulfuricurvum sp.]